MANLRHTYARYQDVVEQLHQLCHNQLRVNNLILPTEQELVSLLGASLMTVRKAVNCCIQEGQISRCGRRTTIIPYRPLAKAGKILFLSGNGMPVLLPGFERLYLKIHPEIERLGGNVTCLVDTPQDDPGMFQKCCDMFDLILVTILPPGPFLQQKLDYLKHRRAQNTVISLSDTYADDFQYVVALDNESVGRAAANYLNENDCHHALVLGCLEDVVLFQKRLSAFREAFQGECKWLYRTTANRDNLFLQDEFDEISRGIKNHIDSIFFASDEWTQLLTERLFTQGYAPEKIKLITSNGSGECLRCNHPLPYLTRSTTQVARETIELICALTAGKKIRQGRRLIAPELRNYTFDDVFHQSLDWHCRHLNIT